MLKTLAKKDLEGNLQTHVDIKDLVLWDKNPREILKIRFEELKERLKTRPIFRPVLVNTGKHFGVEGQLIGGNMRYRAFLENGNDTVWVNLVSPTSEKEFIQWAVEDNERFGSYLEKELAELLQPYSGEEFLQHTMFDLGSQMSGKGYLASIGPDAPLDPEMGMETDPTKKLDPNAYANAQVKQMVLFFTGDQYPEIIGKVERYKELEGKTNQTEFFLFLLDFYERNKSN